MAIPSSRKKPHMSVKVVTNTELAIAGSIFLAGALRPDLLAERARD